MGQPDIPFESAHRGVTLVTVSLDSRKYATVQVNEDTAIGRYAYVSLGNAGVLCRDPAAIEKLAVALARAAAMLRAPKEVNGSANTDLRKVARDIGFDLP